MSGKQLLDISFADEASVWHGCGSELVLRCARLGVVAYGRCEVPLVYVYLYGVVLVAYVDNGSEAVCLCIERA